SYMLGINYFYGAVVIGILTALGIGVINQNSRVKSDSSIGIVFSAMFALGIILITAAQSATDLTQILFGNVLSRSEEHTSELQSRFDLVCRLLLEKKKKNTTHTNT